MRFPALAAVSLVAFVGACSSSDTVGPTPISKYDPVALPALTDVQTTLDRTIVPTKTRNAQPDTARYLFDVDVRTDLLAQGYGDFTTGPGEKTTERAPPNQTEPPPGPNKKLLTRFVHMPDLQLADDEAPTRLLRFDTPGATSGAFRPQDGDECRVVNAAVRTINALNGKSPIDFVLLGGDNADSALDNELGWVLDILGGAPSVECDSGADDDPVKGPGNDGKDPFVAEGLKMPFYWVNGNHDVLVQGNFVVNDEYKQQALGTKAVGGTRDWRLPGGGLGIDDLPPDPNRKHLNPADVMAKVVAHKGGHGMSQANVQSGRAFYTFDIPNTPFRFVILDTTGATTGASEGVMKKSEIDTYVKPALDKAKADGKLVLLASHHSVQSLGDGTGLGGKKVDDAMTQDEYKAFIGQYDNVLFSIVGHSHEHRVRYQEPTAGHGWWEVMTSALADYPHELRIIELYDDDNGWIRLRTVLADYSTEGDPVAAEAKKLGILDYTSGWCAEGSGVPSDRNVELLIKKP
jgi:3',5'-cyclic AMP phosphodiesterase CpdA